MTTVSVVVPLRPGEPERDQAWAFLSARWRERFPDWEVIVTQDDPGAWRKGVAVARGMERARGEIVIVADADVWADGVADAVELVERGAPWAMGYTRLFRFNPKGTAEVLSGADLNLVGARSSAWIERPYTQNAAGGLVVLPASTARRIPIDTRFAGWGGEDGAWRDALDTLAGPKQRAPGSAYHLWHPPQPRMTRIVGSRESNDLRRRYQIAKGHPGAMARIIAEFVASP